MKPPLEIRNGEVTYVMRCGDYVKIGHSIDPEKRRLSFTPGNPLEITIIATFPCGELYERFLHIKFKGHWHRDEWFRIEGDIAAWIAKGCPHKKEIRSLLKLNRERAEAYAGRRQLIVITKEARAARVVAMKRADETRIDYAKALAAHKEWRRQNPPPVMEIPKGTTQIGPD